VGREVAQFLTNAQRAVVVIDRDVERVRDVPYASVQGDVTEDETLLSAGILRAATLVAALDTDADNLYVTVAAKSMRPELQIIARARSESSEPKLMRAGADRVVNPQQLGGDRMASFVTQPHVVDFVDIVMHDGTLEFRLEELVVSDASSLAGRTIRTAHLRDRTGALVLAIRRPHDHVGRRVDQRRDGGAARGAGSVRSTTLNSSVSVPATSSSRGTPACARDDWPYAPPGPGPNLVQWTSGMTQSSIGTDSTF
jgi:Trk K+ transport system NAD-binding subunit